MTAARPLQHSSPDYPARDYFAGPDAEPDGGPTLGGPAPRSQPTRAVAPVRRSGSTPSIADIYADLLQPLNERQRKGVIARLSVGYFEGWRPTRQEMAQLVAHELRRSHPRRP